MPPPCAGGGGGMTGIELLLAVSIGFNLVSIGLDHMSRRAVKAARRAIGEAEASIAAARLTLIRVALVDGMLRDLDFAHATAGDGIAVRVFARFEHDGHRVKLELTRIAKPEVAA